MSRKGDFSERVKREIRARAQGRCEAENCNAVGRDCAHIHPVVTGGPGTAANGRLLCPDCHAVETRRDIKVAAKIRRLRGVTKSQWHGTKPSQGKLKSRGFDKTLRRRMNGAVERKQ